MENTINTEYQTSKNNQLGYDGKNMLTIITCDFTKNLDLEHLAVIKLKRSIEKEYLIENLPIHYREQVFTTEYLIENGNNENRKTFSQAELNQFLSNATMFMEDQYFNKVNYQQLSCNQHMITPSIQKPFVVHINDGTELFYTATFETENKAKHAITLFKQTGNLKKEFRYWKKPTSI